MRKKLTEKQNKLLETFAIIMLIVFALISYFITNLINGNKEEIRNVVIYVNGEKITHVNGEIIDINIDKTFIQSKMLNKSKGPAVHSLRAQADKSAYSLRMQLTNIIL